jgi:hypothetical protein
MNNKELIILYTFVDSIFQALFRFSLEVPTYENFL